MSSVQALCTQAYGTFHFPSLHVWVLVIFFQTFESKKKVVHVMMSRDFCNDCHDKTGPLPHLDLSFWSFFYFFAPWYNRSRESEKRLKKFKGKLVKCATEVARLHEVLYKVVHKNGHLRKFNCACWIEFNFFTAWTIFMKLGTLVYFAHGCKLLPQIFNFCRET